MPKITEGELQELVLYRTLGTHAVVTKKVNDLEKDNAKQRGEIRDLKAVAPKEGEVLLSKEDGVEFKAFKELGKAADVKTRLETGSAAEQKVEGLTVRAAALEYVKAAGLAESAVETIVALPDLKGAKFEVRKEKGKNDKGEEGDVSVPYLTLAGDGEKPMSFADLQEKVPALKGLRPAKDGETTDTTKGQEFIKQGTEEGGKGKSSIYDRIRKDAADKKEAATKKTEGRSVQDRMGMTAHV